MSRRVVIVTTGTDPITAPAVEYLESIGVPAGDIKRIETDSEVGQPQTITVTLYVRPRDDG